MLLQTILIMTTSSEKVDLAVFIEVAEKILNKEELEFYKWNGDLSQLLQNVREKLNRVAEVICYRKVPSEEQIKDLLRKKNFEEAISLVEELQSEGEMTKEMLSFVHAQVGLLLLFDLHFEEAVNHFLLSETMQPSEIFPFVMRDPNRWSLQDVAAKILSFSQKGPPGICVLSANGTVSFSPPFSSSSSSSSSSEFSSSQRGRGRPPGSLLL